jgi:hypothetical protein
MKNSLRLVLACAVPLTAACGAWGVTTTTAEPVGEVEVTSAPVDIDDAPQVVYDGHPVYLSNDRWYYRDGAQWKYYAHEPNALVQHGQQLRQQGHREQRRPQQRTQAPKQPQREEERQHR